MNRRVEKIRQEKDREQEDMKQRLGIVRVIKSPRK
jgi:hypothetical protein